MNILLITPHFPTGDVYRERADDPRTKFLYDYAVEWTRQGHVVRVIHTIPRYPAAFNAITLLAARLLGSGRIGLRRFVQDPRTVQPASYLSEGVRIIRIPVPKLIPHRHYPAPTLRALLQKVDALVPPGTDRPDFAVADFLAPSLVVADHIRRRDGTPFFQLFHQSDVAYLKADRDQTVAALRNAAGFLFRSPALKSVVALAGCESPNNDFVYSGVPANTPAGHPRTEIRNLLYVGTLRRNKNVHDLIRALAGPGPCRHLALEIVGSGPYEQRLRMLARTLGLDDRIRFTGRLSRERVFERMRQADCLVMVSRETFGMVYVEAMSQGCVVVAARGQGIDGVVVDGENGFLADLERPESLAPLLARLNRLPPEQVAQLSRNALATAASMRDDVLARRLLECLKTRLGTAP